MTRLLLALLCSAAPIAAQGPAVGARAPVLTVQALDGAAVTINPAATKRPAVIEFWATWCRTCDALLPGVRAAHARFGAQVDFYGVNVTVNESRRRVERWVAREAPPYRTLYDETGTAVRAFGAQVTSHIVIVDAAGIVRYVGVGSEQDLVTELAKVVTQ